MPRTSLVKKLVSVSTISSSITEAGNEALTRFAVIVLDRVSCIYYLVQFRKDRNNKRIKALIDSRIKVNVMTPTYASKLGLRVRETNVKALKINGFTLETYEMVLATF